MTDDEPDTQTMQANGTCPAHANDSARNQLRNRLRNGSANQRDAASITEADAADWRVAMKNAGYAPATISRDVLHARQIFRWGMRRGLASGNPFAQLKAGPQTNPAKQAFIDRATIAKVIDAAPDAEWRLLIALSRFGGLRVPSEALALRWSDCGLGTQPADGAKPQDRTP